MKIETAPFDAADYLTDEDTIAEYLTAALEDPDSDMFLVAVKDVARARYDTVGKRYWFRKREPLQSTCAWRTAQVWDDNESRSSAGCEAARRSSSFPLE